MKLLEALATQNLIVVELADSGAEPRRKLLVEGNMFFVLQLREGSYGIEYAGLEEEKAVDILLSGRQA